MKTKSSGVILSSINLLRCSQFWQVFQNCFFFGTIFQFGAVVSFESTLLNQILYDHFEMLGMLNVESIEIFLNSKFM